MEIINFSPISRHQKNVKIALTQTYRHFSRKQCN